MSGVLLSEHQLSSKGNSWKSWSRNDWNSALFEHFFRDTDGEDSPVYRISVTQTELAKIAGQPDVHGQEIQDALLNTIRTPTHIDLNKRLRKYPIDPRTGWPGREVPPFFIELAFSCLVASPPDDEIRKDGDFRRRLALLLGHDVTMAQYPLAELPELWRAFSLWLDERRKEGAPYRRLELPPLDHQVRIGYSVQLAFPSRKDHNILVDILLQNSFPDTPPVPAIVEAVGEEIARFSDSFRTAYDDFRTAFSNNVVDLAKYPFWVAVKEAVSTAKGQPNENGKANSQLKFISEPGGIVLLLGTKPQKYPGGELALVEIDTPYGGFPCVLCDGDPSQAGFTRAAEGLLNGQYHSLIMGSSWSAINTAIRQGILLFERTDNLGWELAFVRPNDGEIKGLIQSKLISQFLDSFPARNRPEAKESRYVDWVELSHFPATWLQLMKYAGDSVLSGIRCLQPTAYSPRLTLLGGCSVLDGYLGIPHLLPVVRAPMCDAVLVIPDGSNVSAHPIELERVDLKLPDFSFPDDLQWSLTGSFRIVGTREARVHLQKNATFYPEIIVNAYGQPKDPVAWELEAGGPDLVTYRDMSNQIGRLSDSNNETPSSVSASITRCKTHYYTSSLVRNNEYNDNDRDLESHSVWEPSSFTSAIRYMETCGGMAMKRRGIAESDMIDIIKGCLGVVQQRDIWNVLRAWIEGGYFDRLGYRRWKRTEYYARIPRFSLVVNVDGRIRGTLFGLATSAYRQRADVELLSRGCQRIPVNSSSKWVMPSPAWTAHETAPFLHVSKLLGLEEPFWIEPTPLTLWPLSDVVANCDTPPRFYDMSGSWDWEHGWFSNRGKASHTGIEVLRFSRPDRPSYYQVTADGESVWWSRSRNWVLLFAHELSRRPVFSLSSTSQVVRICKGQVYLPLPIGRYLAQTGTMPPSPISESGSYRYVFQSNKERECMLSAFLGAGQSDTAALKRWARWILSLSRRPNIDPSMVRVSIPFDIQRKLARFRHVPEIRELIHTRFHPDVLYRIRAEIRRFSHLEET